MKRNSQVVRIHVMKAQKGCGSTSPPTDDFKINQIILPQKLNISFHSALRLWEMFNVS